VELRHEVKKQAIVYQKNIPQNTIIELQIKKENIKAYLLQIASCHCSTYTSKMLDLPPIY